MGLEEVPQIGDPAQVGDTAVGLIQVVLNQSSENNRGSARYSNGRGQALAINDWYLVA